MESFVPSVTIESTTTNLSSKTLKELFEKEMKHLKDHASYVFASPKREPKDVIQVSYWIGLCTDQESSSILDHTNHGI
jgi:hypothetical protein